MQWEIIHIPVKPSSSIEQSTVDVLTSKIEPKLANKLMGPLDILLHVNRVRRSSVKGCEICCHVKRRMGRKMQALANILPSTDQVSLALVHQGIRLIFYAFQDPYAGALHGVYRLQGEKSLDHHYFVFRILIPEKALYLVFRISDDGPLQN